MTPFQVISHKIPKGGCTPISLRGYDVETRPEFGPTLCPNPHSTYDGIFNFILQK